MAEHANSTTTHTSRPSRRRTLFAAAGAVITGSGITAGADASVADLLPQPPTIEMTPITAAAVRIKHLSALDERDLTSDENDAVSDEQCRLFDLIMDSMPQTLVDAIVLLMVASAETRGDYLEENGTHGFERGDIMVRRVMGFLSDHAAVNLADYGGTFLLTSDEHEALAFEGTVLEAAARFNKITPARAQERHRDEWILNEHHKRVFRAEKAAKAYEGRA